MDLGAAVASHHTTNWIGWIGVILGGLSLLVAAGSARAAVLAVRVSRRVEKHQERADARDAQRHHAEREPALTLTRERTRLAGAVCYLVRITNDDPRALA